MKSFIIDISEEVLTLDSEYCDMCFLSFIKNLS